MSIEQYSFSDYLQAFRRRAKVVTLVFVVIFGTAAAVALALPDVYRSSAEFRIDLQGPNVEQLRPVEMTNYADQYVRSLQQRVLSHENRRQWLENNPELFSSLREETEQGELIARIQRNANIGFVMTTVLEGEREVDLITGFRVSFEAPDPDSAHIVADEMARAFMAEDRATRMQRATTATNFLEGEIEQKRKELVNIESEIAEFKEEHAGTLPEMRNFNMTSLERAERELETIQTDIRTAEQDLIFRRAQLEEMRLTSPSAERLQELENQYLEAVSVYGPEHPDVARIRRQVAALTGSGSNSSNPEIARLESELASLRERYSDEHPDVASARRRLETLREQQQETPNQAPTNTEYLQLSAEINATESRLEGLRQRATELRNRIGRMESRLSRMPQVEKEYLSLQRELETAQLAYDDLRQRAAQARQTQAFESGERGARIERVTSADRPSAPSGPPRLAIAVLGFLFAGTVGVGTAIGSEATDSTIRGSKDISSLLQTRPIATIPIVENSVLRAQKRRRFLIGAIAVGILVAVAAAIYSSLST